MKRKRTGAPEVPIYAVEGASYDGCNGWSTWIMKDTITTDINEAFRMAEKYSSTYVRTSVVQVNREENDA